MGIDIIVPVLGRPQNAQRLVDSIRATCDHPVIFLCSPGDVKQIAACLETGERTEVVRWPAGKADFAKKINEGCRLSQAEYIFMAADDLDFEEGWDERVLAVGRPVVGTNDKANGSVMRGLFSTHCLIERRYVTEQGASADGPGLVLHEGYDHNFVDRELAGVSQHRGVWGFAKKAIVRHRHPLWKTAPDDDTYRKSLKHFHKDRQLFLRRAHLWGFEGVGAYERRPRRMVGGGRRR